MRYQSSHTCQDDHYQKKKLTRVSKDMEKLEPSCTVGGNVKWCDHCGKQNEDSSKKSNTYTIQECYFWVFINKQKTKNKKNLKSGSSRDICTSIPLQHYSQLPRYRNNQMSMDRYTYKQNVVQTHNGILCSHKKKELLPYVTT